MFDLNAIVSAALSAAVQQAVAPLVERIATLESANDILHRTQHEDMVAMRDRIAALETKLTEANLFTQTSNATITIDEARMVEALNSQEWFWEKLTRKAGEVAEAAVEEAMDEHTSTYDHDDYDSHVSDDDKHFDGDIEDAIRDALSNMSFDISIR